MTTTTTETIADKEITEISGIARGSTVHAKSVASDFMARLKNL